MKKILLISIIALFALTANAKVWRLNNTPGISADFSDWNTAYSTANAGDTIYVEGSVYNYGDITISKPLVLIGSGYFLTENTQTQKLPYPTTFNSLTINSGSNGSVITGLSFNSIEINCGYISILKNKVIGTIGINAGYTYSNIKISQNYLNQINGGSGTGSKSNILINNNIIIGGGNFVNFSNNYYSGIIVNNVFKTDNPGYYLINSFGFAITNNAFIGGYIQNQSFNTYTNNICSSTQLPSGNSNQLNVDMNSVFVNSGSTDGRWKLITGSPAIGAGTNGIDCGAFGGDEPYILSGLPAIPAIYQITSSGVGTVNSGLNVNVKAKTH